MIHYPILLVIIHCLPDFTITPVIKISYNDILAASSATFCKMSSRARAIYSLSITY